MAKKKKALGRGLSSLIPVDQQNKVISSDENKTSGLQEIDLTKITVNPINPRKNIDEEGIAVLSDNLKRNGLIQPITVQLTAKGNYQIIVGERRYRAAKKAGFKKIPALVKKVTDKENAVLSLIENIQREGLDPVEEAEHYQLLIDSYKMKHADIANEVGQSRATISNKLRLLKLPDTVRTMLADHRITEGQVRPLLGIQNPKTQTSLAEKIEKEGWSARRVEDEIKKMQNPAEAARSKKPDRKDPSIRSAETRLRGRLGTKVSIQHNTSKGSGKLVIEYYSVEDLERIEELLGD